MIEQSYSVFNTYGKTPDDVNNQIKAFNLVLEFDSPEDISAAFAEWLKGSPTFPTPHDIVTITDRLRKDRAQTERYSALRLEAPEKVPKASTVPWHGLMWPAFTTDHKRQLNEHLIELGPKARAYKMFLRDHCGAPFSDGGGGE